MEKARIHYIDVAKGIAIVLTILGHCAVTALGDHSRCFYTIYAFHMPLWFFLSGLLYSTKNWQVFFSRKVESLLLPYLFYSILNILSYQLLNYLNYLNLHTYVRFGGLWFLLSLFYVVVMYFAIDTYCLRRLKAHNKRLVITIFSCLSLIVGMNGGKSQTISALSTTLVCFFFFHVGTFVKPYKNKLNLYNVKTRFIILLLSIVLIVLLVYAAPMNPSPIDVTYGRYGNKIMFVSQAFLGILGFLLLAMVINKSKIIEYLGKNSLLILVIHIPLWHLFDTIMRIYGVTGYLNLFCVFVCVLSVTSLALIPINKYLPELKGQFNVDILKSIS